MLEVLDSNTTTKRSLRPVDLELPAFHDFVRQGVDKLWTRSDDVDVVMMVNKLPQPLPGRRYELYVTSNGSPWGC